MEKRCVKCGVIIINGVNGCTLMDDCFTCHGGYPKYPAPIVKAHEYSDDEINAILDDVLHDDDALQ